MLICGKSIEKLKAEIKDKTNLDLEIKTIEKFISKNSNYWWDEFNLNLCSELEIFDRKLYDNIIKSSKGEEFSSFMVDKIRNELNMTKDIHYDEFFNKFSEWTKGFFIPKTILYFKDKIKMLQNKRPLDEVFYFAIINTHILSLIPLHFIKGIIIYLCYYILQYAYISTFYRAIESF